MPNGMESDRFKFKVIEGLPSKELLEDILFVYKSIFDDYKLDFFKNRIRQKEDLIIILCSQHSQLLGFKQLAQLQEKGVKEKGYLKIRTKSMNRFKPMMILNLKNGFDITKTYTNDKGQTKIVFEKLLK